MIINFLFILSISVLSFMWSTSMMASLISLELSWCWIYCILHSFISEGLDALMSSEVLSVMVCESVIGLAFLINFTHSSGNLSPSLSGCSKI
uniref:NADH dehydrogenase subunit 4L n=1 Tax=Pediculus schaeffi TaxID=240286 RepID=M4VR53_PEDSC|nr:NADH dehydrogenase subunit 4L [Pediculus schaeffi]